ncbi:lysylphosphatidylglycerol synthase domain-containing protein [Terracoccus sp. 273MFTsu3.1]|uniref:lysylphosphatidylglycerol synthase domain-containing protein n=1 Tax=Terracoccus sp. 273MFTsu3.1 TaxID=1172188 RepID=UPI0003705CA1|nr:lysylphosphatidylglycerol synthase domain-containing protein [Terracoccus sp. 273MFTsu3.1]
MLVGALRIGLTLVALWWFSRVVRRVNWSAVWDAVTSLAPAQVVALLGVVALRQCLNAGPLAVFVPSLGLRRAVSNDLSANLVATVAPPPGDVVLRIAMLRSWGIPPSEGIAGITLNTLTYYVARFGAPVLGLGLAAVAGQAEPAYVWTAVSSGAVSLVVVVGLVIASRGERPAARAAGWVGRQLRRVTPRVDPAAWSTRATEFVRQAGDVLRRGWGRAMACQVGLVLSEALLLVLSLRFAGVPAIAAPTVTIVVALLVSYPLTALPFGGVGVLDAAVIAVLGLEQGPFEARAVAGLVVFRVCWMLVPLALGAVTVAWWRRGHAAESAAVRSATREG